MGWGPTNIYNLVQENLIDFELADYIINGLISQKYDSCEILKTVNANTKMCLPFLLNV